MWFQLRAKLALHEVSLGCIETWLLYRLTREKLIATDYSCASGTGLFDPYQVNPPHIVYFCQRTNPIYAYYTLKIICVLLYCYIQAHFLCTHESHMKNVHLWNRFLGSIIKKAIFLCHRVKQFCENLCIYGRKINLKNLKIK